MPVIKIISGLKSKTVNTQKSAISVRHQEAGLISPDSRPRPLQVTPPQGQEYPKCSYSLSADSFSTNRFDGLELSRYFRLVPLKEAIENIARYEK